MARPRVFALIGSALVLLGVLSGVSPMALNASTKGGQGEIFAVGAPGMLPLWLLALALYIWIGTYRLPVPENPSMPAGLIRRFVAFYIDLSICYVVIIVPLVLLVLGVEALTSRSFAWEVELVESSHNFGAACLIIVTTPILLILLLSWPEAKQRFSPGMLVSGFYLYSPSELSVGRAVLRSVMGFLTLAGIVLSGPMALAREDRRMWHDLAFGTYPQRTVGE